MRLLSLPETSAAADAAITAAVIIAGSPPGFSVLALGRLGTEEFDLLSDADLLFVRDESLDSITAHRSAQQIVHALSAYTREGAVFPVDARLRPHGGAGELVMTPSQLETYFQSEAQPWEALTFTKLRHIAGSAELSERAVAGVRTFTSRFAPDPEFVPKVMEMRDRIESASAPRYGQAEAHSYERSLKSGPGGIYDTDFLVSAMLVLNGLSDANGDYTSGNLRQRLCGLQSRGLISPRDGEQLQSATDFLRAVDHAIRLATGRKALLASEGARRSTAELAAHFLGRELEPDLFNRLAEVRSSLREAYLRLMGTLRTSTLS